MAEHLIALAREHAAHAAATRTEPEWGDDVLSMAIWADYQRLRSEQRAREVAAFEATVRR